MAHLNNNDHDDIPKLKDKRNAFQKSYSVESSQCAWRRSLIEDAKLESKLNKLYAPGELLEEDEDTCRLYTISITTDKPSAKGVIPHLAAIAENANAIVQSIRLNPPSDILMRVICLPMEMKEIIHNIRREPCVQVSSNATADHNVWFPRHVSELDKCVQVLTSYEPDSDVSHPGWKDANYRRRRDEITAIAINFKHGEKIPRVEYTEDETRTWSIVYKAIENLIYQHGHSQFVYVFDLLKRELNYNSEQIPQLEDVSCFLRRKTGFTLRPVSGLLTARDFLASLAYRVFQCTQYVRHSETPHHTVEPDCIHELIGHVPLLADEEFANFSQELGLASIGATDDQIERLATLYWFTVEFGLCLESGEVKVIGAGLMSSFGELLHAISDVPERKELNMEQTSLQEYQDQEYQPIYFVAKSFEDMKQNLRHFVENHIKRPFHVIYDPITQSIKQLTSESEIDGIITKLKHEIRIAERAKKQIYNQVIPIVTIQQENGQIHVIE